MTWNSTMGLISTIAIFLPLFLIIALRLSSYRTFPALLIYYFSLFIYNLFTMGYLKADPQFIRYWGLTNNFMDTPLLLTFLIYFSSSVIFTRRIKAGIVAFIAFEAIVIALFGMTVKSVTIILGPGIAVSIGLSTYLFIRQSKISILHRKATGKALIAASLLFAYGCYGILYVLYYVVKTTHIADSFLVYFLIVTISSGMVSAGIILEQKRIRKLQELKITRRELSHIYSSEKSSIGIPHPVRLDFDRDAWN
jgi:hypothetical protein